jgi:hypothetical protein
MTKTGAVLAAVALLAACGGSEDEEADETTPPTTTEISTTTVVKTSVETATTTPETPAAAFPVFRMPSDNIACRVFGSPASLRCDVLSGLRPQPQGACELDWAGLYLEQTGEAKLACAGDSVYQSGSPVLGYGRRWQRGALACLSESSGLECRNESGNGFFLSRARWDTF